LLSTGNPAGTGIADMLCVGSAGTPIETPPETSSGTLVFTTKPLGVLVKSVWLGSCPVARCARRSTCEEVICS
jgi:hypothetical protein